MVLTPTGYVPIEVNANGNAGAPASAQSAPGVLKYNPNQPRVQAGNPDGGQWTSEDGNGSSGDSTTRPGTTVDGISHPGTQYAALDTGTQTDATEGTPSNSPAHDDSAQHPIEAADNDWRSLPVNLVEEEAPYGSGHAIARHIGKTEAELIAQFPQASFYSLAGDLIRRREGSFDSIENANDLVNRTLQANSDEVDLVASGKVASDFIQYRFGFVTGYEVYRPQPYGSEFETRKTYGVGVRIVHDARSPRGFRVITAYPMNFD